MTSELNWNKINIDNSRVKSNNKQGDGDRKKLVYVTLGNRAKGKTYILRPVKNPVGFYKALLKTADGRWNNVVIPMDDEGGDTYVRNHPLYINHNVPFQAKYAINVIDREDNQLKILEGGVSIFEAFSKYHEMTEQSPGAKKGADFKVEVTGQKGKDYYKVCKHQNTVLTDEEIKFLQEEGLYDLKGIYKETPEDRWKGWIDQLEETDDAPAPKKQEEEVVAASKAVEETTEDLDSVLDGDDLPFV